MKHLVIIFICICLIACQQTAPNIVPDDNADVILNPSPVQKIGWNLGFQPTSLDPQLTDDIYGQQVIAQLYTGLFCYRGDAIENALCQSYTLSDNGLDYIFKLKSTKWSDGSDVTAYDFEYAWRRSLRRYGSSANGYYFSNIAGYTQVVEDYQPEDYFKVRAIDKKTLSVSLVYPDRFFIEKLALPAFMPVKQTAVSTGDNWHQDVDSIVSNGPFYLAEVNENISYVLRKNPNYYQAQRVRLESIIVEMIGDDTSKYIAYKNNRVQIVDKVLPATIDNLRTARQAFYTFDVPMLTFALLNTSRAPLNDKNIRMLLFDGLDRSAVVTQVTKLEETPATGVIPQNVSFAKGESFRKFAGNYGIDTQDANLSLVDQFNLSPSQFTNLRQLRLIVHTGTMRSQVAQYLSYMWLRLLGIKTDVVLLNWRDYKDALKFGNYDIALVDWHFPIADPETILKSFENKRGTLRWDDTLFLKLIDKAQIDNERIRMGQLSIAEKYMLSQAIVIPIYYSKDNSLVNNKLMDWSKTPTGYWNFTEAWLAQ